jgi:hypothetical protein
MTSTLTDHLRALPDDGLGALLQLRPDLVVPVPADIPTLASRAQGRVSVARALDGLDQFTLEILDGLRLVRQPDDTTSIDALLPLAAEAGVEPAQVRTAVDRLRARFLAYGPDHALCLVPAIEELSSPYPVGLGRPASQLSPESATLAEDPARLRRTLLSAAPEARAILDRLAAGPPLGAVSPASLRPRPGKGGRPAATTTPRPQGRARTGTRAGTAPGTVIAAGAPGDDLPAGDQTESEPESPVRWLVEHHLLVAIGDDLVELPREVGIVLRRDTGPLGVLHPNPPTIAAPARSGADSAGAGQALEAVRHLDALLGVLAEAPAPVLRSFGLGVRDLRRLARDGGVTEPDAALLLELAYAAGLLTYTDAAGAGGDQRWLPSPAYDAWRTASLARRWATLARVWLRTTRAPAMVGQRDDKDKLISALSIEANRLAAPALRRSVLTVLAGLPEGTPGAEESVLGHLSWQSPRRMGRPTAVSGPAVLARAALTEAATLGVTGLGAMTSYGRVLLAETSPDPDDDPLGIHARADEPADNLLATLGSLLPAPVDHMLVQADLTVVVPGPPQPALAAELSMIADTESRGGATVYRVTTHSVRRALDSGYTAADLHALFGRRSRTPLPQTLSYLIDDVARRHGGLRAGAAGAYLRGDDEALISEVFADRRLAPLSLRRLAPTVLVTPAAPTRLLDCLRDAGYAPVPEDATGAAVLSRPKAPRAPARPAPRAARPDDFDPPRLFGPRLAGVVEQIRLGDRVSRAARRSHLPTLAAAAGTAALSPTQAHLQALAVLQQALRDQTQVWVGYVDAHGSAASRLVRPVSMGAGFLRAEDDRTQMLHTFALHRITSAVLDG